LSHYPLGNTGIGVYARGRAAAMYGRRHGTFYTTNATGALTSGEQLSAQAVLPYTDMEVGLDWNRCAGYSTLFAQVGFVGQAYYGIGNPAYSSTVGPLGAAPGTFGGPTANDMSNLVLIGLRATAGVNF
jgi:hypothetical protein